KGGSGPELSPLLVRYHYPSPARDSRVRPMSMDRMGSLEQQRLSGVTTAYKDQADNLATLAAAPPVVPAQEQEAAVETGGYQAIFRVPGRVSVAANEGAKSFRITTATIAPDLLVRAVPALDETAYLEASLKHGEEAPLLPGRVALYRDGIFVGRGLM